MSSFRNKSNLSDNELCKVRKVVINTTIDPKIRDVQFKGLFICFLFLLQAFQK